MPIEIRLTPMTPIDAFERRAEWQLATILVALVVVPGAIGWFENGPVHHLAPCVDLRRRPVARRIASPASPIRPPRGC